MEQGTILRSALIVAAVAAASLVAFSQTRNTDEPRREIRGQLPRRNLGSSPVEPMLLTSTGANPVVTSDAGFLYVIVNRRVYKVRKSDLKTEAVENLAERVDRSTVATPPAKKKPAKRTTRRRATTTKVP